MTTREGIAVALSITCMLAMACTASPRPGNDADLGRDAFVPPVDAWRPDTGPPPPPTCGGTPMPCSGRTGSAECLAGGGCHYDRCRGTPRACESNFSAKFCDLVQGCYWNGDDCYGEPEPCEPQTTSFDCLAQDCSWDSSPSCTGTPTSCASLHGAACTDQPGCVSLTDAGPPDGGGLDAGSDAGARDGGRDGGAAACMVTDGTCSPFTRTSCTSSQTCIANGMAPHCITSSTSPRAEGAACSADNQCAFGLECHSFDAGTTFQCTRYCHQGSTSDCSATSRCIQLAYTGSTCLRVCAPMAPACDLVAQDCATGTSCYVYVDSATSTTSAGCFATGTATVGSSCMYLNSCVRGASCIGSPGVCRHTCNTTADCTSGACTGTVAGFHYCQ